MYGTADLGGVQSAVDVVIRRVLIVYVVKTDIVMIRVPPQMKRRLAAEAKKDGRPLSAYVRRILEIHLAGGAA